MKRKLPILLLAVALLVPCEIVLIRPSVSSVTNTLPGVPTGYGEILNDCNRLGYKLVMLQFPYDDFESNVTNGRLFCEEYSGFMTLASYSKVVFIFMNFGHMLPPSDEYIEIYTIYQGFVASYVFFTDID